MTTRPRIGQIKTPGASHGDVPSYDDATDRLVMGPPAPPVTGIGDVIVSVTGGVPHLVFDADSTPVTTEVP